MKSLQLLVWIIIFVFLAYQTACQRENQLPVCEISSPANDAEYKTGDEVLITVKAEDEDGVISVVIFYINEIEHASINTYPYKYLWNTAGEELGEQKIEVIARDDRGDSIYADTRILILPESTSSFIDERDGKEYKTINYGNQWWMAENLNFEIKSGSSIYLHSLVYAEIYGRMYNWETAQNACPLGWHLPHESEWKELENYLISKGYNYDGSISENKIGKSMAADRLWNFSRYEGCVGNEIQSNNSTYFTVLPGGWQSADGYFNGIGRLCNFWTADDIDSKRANCRKIGYDSKKFAPTWLFKDNEIYIRCIKD